MVTELALEAVKLRLLEVLLLPTHHFCQHPEIQGHWRQDYQPSLFLWKPGLIFIATNLHCAHMKKERECFRARSPAVIPKTEKKDPSRVRGCHFQNMQEQLFKKMDLWFMYREGNKKNLKSIRQVLKP